MNNEDKNKFHFFVPADIEKAEDSSSEDRGKMKIKGVASTPDRDSDDEVLDPEGFVLDFFLKSGFLNWHHRAKEDPAAIVGEPTMAEVRDNGLYIEGELYKDSELAKSIYDLAKTLKDRDSSRRLGFSIEGKVLERDLVDDRKIKKALITGCAITPTPKNPHTIMDVMKGKDTSEPMEYEHLEGNDPNGGATRELIVDVTRPDGTRITVDKDLKINVEKTLTTQSGAALIPEDVEGKTKKQEDFSVTKENSKLVTKSKAFTKILDHVDDVEKAEQVYNHLKENSTDMNGTKEEVKDPTSDDIYKALETLGIDPAPAEDVTEEIEKGEGSDEELEKSEGSDEELEKGSDDDELEKAKKSDDDDDEEDDDDDDMSKADYKKLKDDVEKAKKEYEMKKAKLESSSHHANGGEKKKISKGEDDDLSKTDEPVELSGDRKEALETISKALAGFNDLKKDVDELKKAIDENGGVSSEKLDNIEKSLENIEEIDQRLEEVEKRSQGRKSISTKNYIEKSFPQGEPDGSNKLSISKDRSEILGILKSKAGIEKGEINERYADALMAYESSGSISKAIAQDLRQEENVVLTQ